MEYDPATGKRIHEQRERLGWKQKELANKAQLSIATVANAERGTFTKITLGAINNALRGGFRALSEPLPDLMTRQKPRFTRRATKPPRFSSAGSLKSQPIPWGPPIPQFVNFKSGDDRHTPGMAVESAYGVGFVPWEALKGELENGVLIYLGRILGDTPLTVAMGEFNGRKNWVIHIQGPTGEHLGYVWLGGDPDNGWRWDGLVRVGETLDDRHHVVWQIFQRYSNGTYRRIRAFDSAQDRVR